MLQLALPVIVAELGWITMGIVDTIIVGPLGPAAIGAVGSGSTMFLAVMVLGMGTLLALDTFVAQNYGAGRIDECHRWLFAGLQLAGVMSIVLVVAGAAGVRLLPYAGLHPDVAVLLEPYLSALLWSAPALLAFTVFRRYLQAMNIVRPVTAALVSANVINAVGNWMLVYGNLGMPALGVRGSAYATVAARVYMALFLRVMRSGMAEAWKLDFVLFARAKGLSRGRIVLRHVARNALLPLVTMLGLQSAAMLGGSVVIESVFAIPGFGRLAQEAVNGRDAPLLMGIILTSAVLVICVNFIVDLVYAALDPRIGASESRI